MLLGGKQQRGLGVLELVGDLGRGEAPGDRLQDRSQPCAREQRRDVVGRVGSEGRDTIAATDAARGKPGREPLGSAVELGVRQLATEKADRDPVGCRTRPVGEPAPDGQRIAHQA